MSQTIGELYDIADELTQKDIVDITNTESEGEDCLRLDFGTSQSVWLYTNGSAMGAAPAKMKQHLVKRGFVFESE